MEQIVITLQLIGENKERTRISFNDFLKNPENQAEFDRRVQKAIHTAFENNVKRQRKKKSGEDQRKETAIFREETV